jgi:hypothetical protein
MRALVIGTALTLLTGSAVVADEAAALRPLCPDRPTRSTGACTVDAGRWQVETDLVDGTFQRLGGVTTDTWVLASPTVKYGVTDRLDLEATLTPMVIQSVRDHGGATSTTSGFGDLYLRAKYSLMGQGTTSPLALAVEPYVKAPTARDALGDGAWEGGVVLPISYKLNDVLSLSSAPEIDQLVNASGHGRHLNYVDAIGVNWSLPRGVTLSGEVWGAVNDEPTHAIRQASLDFAVALQVGDNVQWDAGVNLGLNHATPGAQLYAGLSRRF